MVNWSWPSHCTADALVMPVSLAISATLVSGVRLRRTVSPVSSLPQLGIQSTYPSTGWRGYRALIPAWPHQHTIGRAAQISQNEHAHNHHQVCLLDYSDCVLESLVGWSISFVIMLMGPHPTLCCMKWTVIFKRSMLRWVCYQSLW